MASNTTGPWWIAGRDPEGEGSMIDTRQWWLMAQTRRIDRENLKDGLALLACLAGLYAGWWLA